MVAIVDRPPAVVESSSPWRSARFRWYYVGSVTSWLGSAMAPIGLGFAVLAFSKSSSALGLVLAARSIPLISFMILGGAVADRISRSQLPMLSNLGSGVTQGAVAVLILSGSRNLGTIIVLEVANGTFSAFTTPAMAGIVPQLVSAGSQQSANSMLSAARADFDQDAGLRFLAAMVKAADLGLTLHDITGPAGVPVVACASASGETVYGAGAGLADAVREALTGALFGYQLRRDPRLRAALSTATPALWTSPASPAAESGSLRPERLVRALTNLGYAPSVFALDHDRAVHEAFPYVLRVVLTRLPGRVGERRSPSRSAV